MRVRESFLNNLFHFFKEVLIGLSIANPNPIRKVDNLLMESVVLIFDSESALLHPCWLILEKLSLSLDNTELDFWTLGKFLTYAIRCLNDVLEHQFLQLRYVKGDVPNAFHLGCFKLDIVRFKVQTLLSY